MQFEGKVVVVTGAAQGIGRGCAEAFAARGASVALLDVAPDRAEEAAGELSTAGCGTYARTCQRRSGTRSSTPA